MDLNIVFFNFGLLFFFFLLGIKFQSPINFEENELKYSRVLVWISVIELVFLVQYWRIKIERAHVMIRCFIITDRK